MSVLHTYSLPNSSENTLLLWAKAFSVEQKYLSAREKYPSTQVKYLLAQEKYPSTQEKYLSYRDSSDPLQAISLSAQGKYISGQYKHLLMLENLLQLLENLLSAQNKQRLLQNKSRLCRPPTKLAQATDSQLNSNGDSSPHNDPMVRWQKGCCRPPPCRDGARPQPTTTRSPIFK